MAEWFMEYADGLGIETAFALLARQDEQEYGIERVDDKDAGTVGQKRHCHTWDDQPPLPRDQAERRAQDLLTAGDPDGINDPNGDLCAALKVADAAGQHVGWLLFGVARTD